MVPNHRTTSPRADVLPAPRLPRRTTTRGTTRARGSSRNDPPPTRHRFVGADHRLRRPVVVLADVLEEFSARAPPQKESSGPRRGIGAGIVDGYLVLQRVEVGSREALDEVQLLGVGRALAIHPELRVEAHRVDDERVALPAADRMSV